MNSTTTHLPERYSLDWLNHFAEKLPPLQSGATVLDIGSGRKPAIGLSKRPDNCRYIGLDVSGEELALAGPGAYTESIVAPIEHFVPELSIQVDLAVSWQVLEHVESVSRALANIREYLKPGGVLVAVLSGKNAAFARLNQVIPERLGIIAMKTLLRRQPDTVFRAKYDDCSYSQLLSHLNAWSCVDIEAHFRGAGYFRFSRPIQKGYLWYENRLVERNDQDRATHYLVRAVK